MTLGTRIYWAVALVAVLAIAAVAITATSQFTFAGGSGDNDQPITGPALEQASEAALEHTGEGRVSETEVGDEDSYYEVEVTLDDGSQVDVQLDEEFNVVGEEADDDSTDDHDDPDTD